MEPLHALQTKLKQHLPQLDLRVAEPMAKHTTFRVGGPAALLALPKGEGEVRQILQLAHQMGVAPFFLGKGSNLLVADEGVNRFLVKLPGGLTRLEREGETDLYVGSGVTLAQAATFAAQAGLSGLEFAHGIPGSLGGGVFMNAGAYDGEMAQVIAWVDCLDETGAPPPPGRGRPGPGLPHQLLYPAALADHRGPPDPDPRGPRRHPGQNGRPGPAPPGQAAPGVPQRRLHLQAPPRPLCRRPH